MAAQNRTTLKYQFRTDQPATEAKFADLIDSFKLVQSPVSSPTASGKALEFIYSISQNAEGVISVTKRTVNLDNYQTDDIQVVERVIVDVGDSKDINHKKGHYPTVRLIEETSGEEVPMDRTTYTVKHADTDKLTVQFRVSGTYLLVLD